MIKFAEPWITENDKKAVADVLSSGWLAQGSKVTEFEEKIAEVSGTDYAVATNSATMAAAIFFDYFASVKPYYRKYGLQPVALLPAITFPSLAVQLKRRGWKIEIADVDPDTWLLKLPEGTNPTDYDLVVPTDYAGLRAPLYSNSKWATPVLVDAACSFGVPVDKNGSFAAAVHSFYANKIITTGNGGALVTDDKDLYDYARKSRLHGLSLNTFERDKKHSTGKNYDVGFAGLKANMTDMQAALGLSQVERITRILNRRKTLVEHYHKRLGALDCIQLQTLDGPSAHCMMPALIQPTHMPGPNRDSLREFLKKVDIQTSMHYPPLHSHSLFSDCKRHKPSASDYWSQEAISLPLHPNLSLTDCDVVCDAVLGHLDK